MKDLSARRAPTKERIEQLEGALLGMPQAASNVKHIFGPNLYIRELFIRAGTFAVGHWQKTEHMNVMVCGRVTVMNDDGTTTELRAPLSFVAKPGRKVGYVHEDMVWLNIYSTDETDVEKLEDMLLDKSATFKEHQKLLEHKPDKGFDDVLAEIGTTPDLVKRQSENEDDLIPFPFGAYKVKIGRSSIHGRGLIATADICAGEVICPSRIGAKRTPAGRYLNHSSSPNATMRQLDGGDVYVVAIAGIGGCCGGEDGEEVTVDYRDVHKLNMAIGITA